jgi:hypothetical protein
MPAEGTVTLAALGIASFSFFPRVPVMSSPSFFLGFCREIYVEYSKLLGLALRARWEWLERTDPSRPWQGLNMLQDSASKLF